MWIWLPYLLVPKRCVSKRGIGDIHKYDKLRGERQEGSAKIKVVRDYKVGLSVRRQV